MILSLYQCQKKQGESGWRTDQIVATKINRSAFLAWYALSKFRPILQQPDHHKGTLIMTTRVEKERLSKGQNGFQKECNSSYSSSSDDDTTTMVRFELSDLPHLKEGIATIPSLVY